MKKKNKQLQIAVWSYHFKNGGIHTCLATGSKRNVYKQLKTHYGTDEIYTLERLQIISKNDINNPKSTVLYSQRG